MKLTAASAALLSLSGFTRADGQFKSRPDLAPPRLNITIPPSDSVSPGYIFVGPFEGFGDVQGGPEQAAAYILRSDGDLVWSSLGYFAGFVCNFQAVSYKGKPALQAFQGSVDQAHGHGYGVPILLDQHYKPLVQIQSRTHKLISMHELKIVEQKTALVEIYQPIEVDLQAYGGAGSGWIVDGVFQEIDIESGRLIFESRSLDWASPHDSVISLSSGRAFTGINASDAWDYFHANSIDKDDEGNYLISGRHTNAVYKINGTDGSLVWQVGGKRSNFSLAAGLDFGYQHDARFLNRSTDGLMEIISLFDNSARPDPYTHRVDRLHPHSRATIVLLNHTAMTATALATYIPPDLLSAPSQGNAQVLDNGHVFVNWGQEGAVTEFAANGTPIFHAYLDSGHLAPGVQSYRGFKYEWTGYSSEIPALVVVATREEVTAYVSWNGDTEVTTWRFYHQCTKRTASHGSGLGDVQRHSFETKLTVPASIAQCVGGESRIFAEGIDRYGSMLTTTESVLAQVAGRAKFHENPGPHQDL